MGIQICRLNLDGNRHESEQRGTPMFPCAAYSTDLKKNVTGGVPWHWHEEIEIAVVRNGAGRLRLDGLDVTLNEHEGIFINSNVLHSASIASPDGCLIDAFVFFPALLSGAPESIYEQKYIRPLISCKSIPGIVFRLEEGWQSEAVNLFESAFALFEEGAFGYELLVREKLSYLWYLLLSQARLSLEHASFIESPDSVRIKKMMNYIHMHYGENLTLNQIAGAAHISERECLRCFKKSLGIPPIKYLMKHRISVAASQLAKTGLSVTEIAAGCGFDTPSYFTQIFKRMFGQTPTEYREQAKNELPL